MIFTKFLEELLFPSSCVICQTDGSMLCGRCLLTLSRAEEGCPFCAASTAHGNTCGRCKKNKLLTRALALLDYEHQGVANIIRSIKYKTYFALLEDLKNPLIEFLLEHEEVLRTAQAIIPAPIRRQSFLNRGFNQAELLSRMVSALLEIPQVNVLSFTSEAKAQHKRTQQERWDHVKDRIHASRLAKGVKHAIVVDDLLTTGATLESCSWALKQQGVNEVSAITLARQKKFFV